MLQDGWMDGEDMLSVCNKQGSKRLEPLTWASQSSPIHRGRKYNGGCQGMAGRRNVQLVFSRYRLSTVEDKKVLEMDTGDGCRAVWMYLMAQTWTLKHG